MHRRIVLRDAGCALRVSRCSMLDAGCSILDVRYSILDSVGWLLDIGYLFKAALFLKAVSNRESSNRLSVSRLFFIGSQIFIWELINQPLGHCLISEATLGKNGR